MILGGTTQTPRFSSAGGERAQTESVRDNAGCTLNVNAALYDSKWYVAQNERYERWTSSSILAMYSATESMRICLADLPRRPHAARALEYVCTYYRACSVVNTRISGSSAGMSGLGQTVVDQTIGFRKAIPDDGFMTCDVNSN